MLAHVTLSGPQCPLYKSFETVFVQPSPLPLPWVFCKSPECCCHYLLAGLGVMTERHPVGELYAASPRAAVGLVGCLCKGQSPHLERNWGGLMAFPALMQNS